MRRTKSQQTLSRSTCAYHNMCKKRFVPAIYAQRSHLDPLNPVNPAPRGGLTGSKSEGSGSGFDNSVRIQWIRCIGIPILPIEHALTHWVAMRRGIGTRALYMMSSATSGFRVLFCIRLPEVLTSSKGTGLPVHTTIVKQRHNDRNGGHENKEMCLLSAYVLLPASI